MQLDEHVYKVETSNDEVKKYALKLAEHQLTYLTDDLVNIDGMEGAPVDTRTSPLEAERRGGRFLGIIKNGKGVVLRVGMLKGAPGCTPAARGLLPVRRERREVVCIAPCGVRGVHKSSAVAKAAPFFSHAGFSLVLSAVALCIAWARHGPLARKSSTPEVVYNGR